jgi:hypothetical protein
MGAHFWWGYVFFVPSGLAYFLLPLPTAYAVGCILSPLRCWCLRLLLSALGLAWRLELFMETSGQSIQAFFQPKPAAFDRKSR